MEELFRKDIERIQSLDIVPVILELICRSTGMGFSAVARVTEDRWITCAVKDDIAFGLQPGSELQIRTTLCDEIRGHHQPIVIDEVRTDKDYALHHTPAMYGFQSYISIPIFLKDGSFFGTLCAIDPRPFPLKENKTVKMFELYADLISYHLMTQETLELKNELLNAAEQKLNEVQAEIDSYSDISQHTLQGPLKRLQVYTEMLVADGTLPAMHESKQLALEINRVTKGISAIITELGIFSSIPTDTDKLQPVELNSILKDTAIVLGKKMKDLNASVSLNPLPAVKGVPTQLGRLFINLLDNALTFSLPGVPPVINIRVKDATAAEVQDHVTDTTKEYYAISVEDNGIGIDKEDLPRVFNLFTRLNNTNNNGGVGMGLAQARKIMHNHGGAITVSSEPGHGSTFTLFFPKV